VQKCCRSSLYANTLQKAKKALKLLKED